MVSIDPEAEQEEQVITVDKKKAPFPSRSLFCPHLDQNALAYAALRDNQRDVDESLARMC